MSIIGLCDLLSWPDFRAIDSQEALTLFGASFRVLRPPTVALVSLNMPLALSFYEFLNCKKSLENLKNKIK